MKLTVHDLRMLRPAAKHEHGYFPKPDHRGFAPSQWRNRMAKFVAGGLATGPNAHKEFTITDAGKGVVERSVRRHRGQVLAHWPL